MDKTLIKGLRLLEALAHASRPRGITELAAELGLHKSNIHRVLATLTHCGYVLQMADGRYAPTLRLSTLGHHVLDRLDIRAVARPALDELGRSTGEDVYLAVLDGVSALYLDRLETRPPLRPHYRLGTRLPAWCTAPGKALLAHADPAIVQAATARLKGYTEATLPTREAVLADLAAARERGYATNRGERESGVWGVAAPILDGLGHPLASLAITAPATRLTEARLPDYGDRVRRAAAAVEALLTGRRASPIGAEPAPGT